MRVGAIAAVLLAGMACKSPFPHYCDVDTPCTDPARSHCDLTGEFNDGAGNVCVPNPFDAGVGPDGAIDAAVGPESPGLLSPRNGYYTGTVHADVSLRPTFRWRPVAAVTGYEIEIDDSCVSTDFAACEFPSPELLEATTDPRFTPTDALDVSLVQPVGERYFWRVRACDESGCGAWSPIRYLNVGRQANDYDGDGYADILVGARKQDGAEVDSGMGFLYFGKPTWTPGSSVVTEDLRILDPSPRVSGFFGGSAFSVGDINADGYADFAVASIPQEIAGVESRVEVYFGEQSLQDSLGENVTLVSPEGQVDTLFGGRIGGGCDIDADGIDDMLVSSFHSNPEAGEGAVFVYLGARLWPNGTVDTPDIVIDNPRDFAGGAFGFATCGDVNGDGIADVTAAAPLQDNPEAIEGVGFIFFGRTSWPAVVEDADVELDNPLDDPGALFGAGVLSGRDLDDDGYEDLVVLAHEASNPEASEGSVFLYFGRDTWQGVLQTADITIDNPADTAGGNFGFDAALADIDGDGIADLVTGAKNNGAGFGYLFFGSAGWSADPTPDVTIADPLDEVGNEFTETLTATDVDGDGIVDVILGAMRGVNPEDNEGNIFLWLGRTSWPAVDPTLTTTFDNPDDDVEGEFGSGLD